MQKYWKDCCFCIKVPKNSYRQGMNEILAPIYMCFAYDKTFSCEPVENIEADAFWSFYNLLNTIENIFDETHEFNINEQGEALNKALFIIDKDLYLHFNENEVHFNMFCYKWIITLFSQCFNLTETTRLWDIIFMEDNKLYYLFFAVISILEIKRDKLLTYDMVNILLDLQNFDDIDIQHLIPTMIKLQKQYGSKVEHLFNR